MPSKLFRISRIQSFSLKKIKFVRSISLIEAHPSDPVTNRLGRRTRRYLWEEPLSHVRQSLLPSNQVPLELGLFHGVKDLTIPGSRREPQRLQIVPAKEPRRPHGLRRRLLQEPADESVSFELSVTG